MKNYLYIFILITSIVSCRNDESKSIIDEDITPEKIDYYYVKKANNYFLPKESNSILEYDNNKRLIHKKGGFQLLPGEEEIRLFTTKIGAKINYVNNTAIVTDYFVYPDNTTYEAENCVYLLDGNRILEKHFPPPPPNVSDPLFNKKLIFKYNNNSQISEIITTFPNRPDNPNKVTETFEYNSSGNLIRTTKITRYIDNFILEKKITEFSDYDNAKNPFKKMILLDDFFYRALSRNNYRRIEEKTYFFEELTSSNFYSWTFPYDSNGNLILAK